MTTFQMEAFVSIVRFMSFSKAAQHLFVSRSALSKTISSLESELNIELFSKKNNKIALTRAGEILHDHCVCFLQDFESLKKDLVSHSTKKKQHLFIGMSGSMKMARLFFPIAEFKRNNEDTELHIIHVTHENYFDQLDVHAVDVVFGWTELSHEENYSMTVLAEDQWSVLVRRDHPLAKFDCVDMLQLKNESFIFPADPTSINKFVSYCQRSGFYPNIMHRFSDPYGSMQLVAHGMGTMFFSGAMSGGELPEEIKLLHIRPALPNNLMIITRKNERNPFINEFCQFFYDSWKNENA